jgi:hypothetical protein
MPERAERLDADLDIRSDRTGTTVWLQVALSPAWPCRAKWRRSGSRWAGTVSSPGEAAYGLERVCAVWPRGPKSAHKAQQQLACIRCEGSRATGSPDRDEDDEDDNSALRGIRGGRLGFLGLLVQLTHRRSGREAPTYPDLAIGALEMLVHGARTESEQLADGDG